MVFHQPGDIRRDRRRAGLDAAVIAVDDGRWPWSYCWRDHRETAHVAMQRSLVALQRQGIVAALIDDLLGDGALAIERVGGHDRPFQRQHLQQLRHRGDLVRFRIGGDLRQHQPLLAAPGADHVQRRLAAGLIEGAAQNLAIDRHDACALLGKPRHEAAESAARNCSGSSTRKSRLNVSWLGTPFSRLRNPRKNGSFDFANRPMSTEPWPPHRTAHMAIAKISWKSCRLAFPVRGSSNPSQQAINFSKTTSQAAFPSRPGRIHFNQNAKRAKTTAGSSNAIPLPAGVSGVDCVAPCGISRAFIACGSFRCSGLSR